MATRDDMTISRFGRGTCPACGRSIRLLKDGAVGPHGAAATSGRCGGWGKKPKEG